MDHITLLKRCQAIAGQMSSGQVSSGQSADFDAASNESPDNVWTAEDAIGFFQAMRPDGELLGEVFRDVPHGEELQQRLQRVYAVAGDPKRPDGAKDAYFVVRKPIHHSAELVEHAGKTWLNELSRLDQKIGIGRLAELLGGEPEIRVLEGQPPKHPRRAEERCELLTRISQFSQRHIEPLEPTHSAALGLRRAYYFIACDSALCEYLLWPVYRQVTTLEDPFEPYFTLWQAGVKYRIFNDHSIDFYMPRL